MGNGSWWDQNGRPNVEKMRRVRLQCYTGVLIGMGLGNGLKDTKLSYLSCRSNKGNMPDI